MRVRAGKPAAAGDTASRRNLTFTSSVHAFSRHHINTHTHTLFACSHMVHVLMRLFHSDSLCIWVVTIIPLDVLHTFMAEEILVNTLHICLCSVYMRLSTTNVVLKPRSPQPLHSLHAYQSPRATGDNVTCLCGCKL